MRLSIERIISNFRFHIIFNNIIIASKGYKIYISKDLGETWEFRNELPVRLNKRLCSNARIIARLLRNGITKIAKIGGNRLLICCDREMYLSDLDFNSFERINVPTRFFQLLDNNICITKKYVYYGEYFPNNARYKVNIYLTIDGVEWEKIYSFPRKSIRHIHLLQYDPFSDRIWFSTGDLGAECMLGNANHDFSNVEIIGANDQKWRCTEIIFNRENLLWGTEDPSGTNWILSLDRANLNLYKIQEVFGVVYNIIKLGSKYMLITANERGEWDKRSHIWCASDSTNGWRDCMSFEKDRYPCIFGFGRLFFGFSLNDRIFLTGQALKGFDNSAIVLRLQD